MNYQNELIIPEVIEQPVQVKTKSQGRVDNLKKNRQPKKHGVTHKVTRIKEKVGLSTWDEFGNWLSTEGIKGYKERMDKLTDKEYIVAYNLVLEYFKPKLSRKQIDIDASIHVDGVSFE